MTIDSVRLADAGTYSVMITNKFSTEAILYVTPSGGKIAIAPAVILSWSITAEGWLLEVGETIDGPWIPLDIPRNIVGDWIEGAVPVGTTQQYDRPRQA